MTETPKIIKFNNTLSYVWAVLILFLIGVVLIGAVLFLRPNYDPLIIIGTVGGMITTILGSLLALMKAQETHLTVNSQLTEWKEESTRAAHSEGIIKGTKEEQERVIEEEKRTIKGVDK